ncbi:MAG: tRNA (adenosine(37)-N6)-threonylcarbamoyltransferase complex dimerization subunit type 1 TsaB [Chlamydiales bacterium]|nr:tRNA (adenosine(37)-N6)-threonylcarbamoyltransferase complex dimerization subunit type 1 TsaB [Chlamydiales bacterium]
MKALVICTSFTKNVLSLCSSEGVISFSDSLPQAAHSEACFFQLEELFKNNSIQDIELIICGVGPGSFTGIRVGAAIAKAFSYAKKIPLVGVNSLKAHRPKEESYPKFINLLDANTPGFFAIEGAIEGDVCSWGEASLIDSVALQEVLKGETPVFSFEIEKLKRKFHRIGKDFPSGINSAEIDAYSLYEEGVKSFKNNDFTLDGRLELEYLRASQAEIELSNTASNG